MNTPHGAPCFSNCSFPYQMEVNTAPAQFRQVTSHSAESSLEFHPHRQHQIACPEASIPDLPSLIRVLALTRIAADLLANYLAELGRAGEVLVAVGRERLGFNIGEANILPSNTGTTSAQPPRWANWRSSRK